MIEPQVKAGAVPAPLSDFADPEVLEALESHFISLQHARILGVLTSDRQKQTLKRLRELASLPGVQELALSIEGKAVLLADLPFSTQAADDKCSSCPHNSTVYAEHFETQLKSGLCMNPQCAQALWETYASNYAETLPSKYKVIRIEPVATGVAISDAPGSVGENQFGICQATCQSFGASVTGAAGKAIHAALDQCFNATCLAEKLSNSRKLQVDVLKERLWRMALQKYVLESSRGKNRVIMLCMLAGGWQISKEFGARIFGKSVDPKSAFELANSTASPESLTDGLHEIAVDLVTNAPLHQVRDLLISLAVPLGDYFPMQRKFLYQLPISDIEDIAKDLGVAEDDTAMMAKQIGSAEFAKAVDALIPDSALIGYIPSILKP